MKPFNLRALYWIQAVVVSVVLIIAPAALLLWPYHPLTVVGQDQILNPDGMVPAGGALIYEINYCKETDKQAAVTRALVGAKITYSLPSSTNNVPKGCKKAISQNTLIPAGVAPGVYHLALSATYRVNPIRFISVASRTEDFTVVAPDVTSMATTSTDTTMVTTTIESSPMLSGASPAVEGTDTVTQEPSTPAPVPTLSPTPTPGLIVRLLNGLGI